MTKTPKRSLRSRISFHHLAWGNFVAQAAVAIPLEVTGHPLIGFPISVASVAAFVLTGWAIKDTVPADQIEQRKVEKFEGWLFDRQLPAYSASSAELEPWAIKIVRDLPPGDADRAARARKSFVATEKTDTESLETDLDYAFGLKTPPNPEPSQLSALLRMQNEGIKRKTAGWYRDDGLIPVLPSGTRYAAYKTKRSPSPSGGLYSTDDPIVGRLATLDRLRGKRDGAVASKDHATAAMYSKQIADLKAKIPPASLDNQYDHDYSGPCNCHLCKNPWLP